MSTDAKAHLEEEVDRMVNERFPEGLVRTLEGKFPSGQPADYEDAVSSGFLQLVRKPEKCEENARGYVTTVAVNAMKRALRRAAIQQLAAAYGDHEDDDANEPLDAYTSAWDDPVIEQVRLDDAYDLMQRLVDAWPTENYKTTMRLLLAAAKVGEPLSSEELAERLGELLPKDVEPATARQWRRRALKRLRRELIEADLIEDTEEQ